MKDIRVEGVQRTEAGTVLLVSADQGRRYARRREGGAGGQGAVRDGLLPRRAARGARTSVLVVIVQERPTISKVDLVRQQGIRHRHAEEGAEGDRRRRRAHLRPLGARPRRAGNQAPVPVARALRGEGHGDGHAAGAQPRRRSTSRSRRATRRRSRGSTSSATAHSRESDLLGADDADHARLDDVVHEERPVLEAEALGRPRNAAAASTRTAATSSSTSTRRRSRSRRTRKTSTSRSTSPKVRSYTVSGRPARRRSPDPGAELSRLVQMQVRRDVFARAAAGERQGDQRPPGHRRLRVRQRQRGARDRPREAARPRSRSIVDPGRRVYIRKINISGNARTRDEVIRREMRQLEGAWYDGARIERSKVRDQAARLFRATSTSRRRRSPARPTRPTSR